MTNFWARFQKVENDIFRYDTRIYLTEIRIPHETDTCIGAIVGKNPGSAKAKDLSQSALQEIYLDGDKLLPSVRNIVLKSYSNAGKQITDGEYIQVLNLFYLCDPDLTNAIKSIRKYHSPMHCDSESKVFQWVWYVWGGEDENLTDFKIRFSKVNTTRHFYFGGDSKSIINNMPGARDKARHTQGLTHELVIPYIGRILK